MNESKPAGEQRAFPLIYPDEILYGDGKIHFCLKGDDGMTLRQYYAAHALQGLLANPSVVAANPLCGWALVNTTNEQLAEYCNTLADALLAAEEAKR